MTDFEDTSPKKQIAGVLETLDLVLAYLPSFIDADDVRAAIEEVAGLPLTEAGVRRATLIGRVWATRMTGDWLGAEAAANDLAADRGER